MKKVINISGEENVDTKGVLIGIDASTTIVYKLAEKNTHNKQVVDMLLYVCSQLNMLKNDIKSL